MAKAYYGSKISENMLQLSDGCLLCRNVPIARTGEYQYLASELGMDGNNIITVQRDESEVFDPVAIASFEGKAFTDDHPQVDVNVDNWSVYAKGEVKDVRRGSGENSNLLVADIYVRDPVTISEIQAGKREISSGYECDYVQDEDGTIRQTKIRGNHVALVKAGRAGCQVCIKDNQPGAFQKYRIVKKLQNAIKKL